MTSRRATQFLLFGGEEEVPESTAPAPETRAAETAARPSPDAVPPDPFVALSERTVQDFEEALGSDEAVRRALCRYFKRGLAASFDHGELVDLLCVSNELLEEAGFSPAEATRIIAEVLPSITDREIASTPLD